MTHGPEADFPGGHCEERELLLDWLRFLRGAVIRKVDGLDEAQARRCPVLRRSSPLART
ncbi:MAG: hypothetical protein ACYDB7_11520 [Mycobacteriales bacterium]